MLIFISCTAWNGMILEPPPRVDDLGVLRFRPGAADSRRSLEAPTSGR
jgi:hypothetical protein